VRFNRVRGTAGLFLAPAALLIMLVAPLPLDPPAHRLAAILSAVVILWVSEAIPAPITAVAGAVLSVVFGVSPVRSAFAPFADPVIFLFIGSFILAEAMLVHGVDRRIAFGALASRAVGRSPVRILVVYGAVATGISMWISNTATAAMLFPIGLAIARHISETSKGSERDRRQFGVALMLMTAFGASVGGMATPVGSPPNLIGLGLIERLGGVRVSFVQWMALGGPIVLVLFAFLAAYFRVVCVRIAEVDERSAAVIRQHRDALGRLSRGEQNVLLAFGVTVSLWLAPGIFAIVAQDNAFTRWFVGAFPESVAALAGAILLFLLPVEWSTRRFTMTWRDASRIDWGTVLLFGGGMALGELAFSTGLAEAMGTGLASMLPSHSSLALILLFSAFAIVLSETTSNTASATMIVPITIAVANGAGVSPLEPAVAATLAASLGFMMPISTPPNAIAYSSGYVPITTMMRHGIVLDVVGFVVVVAGVLLLGPLVF
jgi:sodium-dependent dicarboxylate transporter 2/3/5